MTPLAITLMILLLIGFTMRWLNVGTASASWLLGAVIASLLLSIVIRFFGRQSTRPSHHNNRNRK